MIGKSVKFLLVLSLLSEAKVFRCDYTFYHEARGWLKFHEIPANWEEARLRCHLEGAILASPVNGTKESMLAILAAEKMIPSRGIHTGIHSLFTKGDYATIEGVPLHRIPHQWAIGEPDNYQDTENCIAMTLDGKLGDVNCAHTFSYMCYKKDHHFTRNACGTIDSGYTLDIRTGSCYKFHKEIHTWPYAYKACMAEGGYLAIINNEIEAQVIRDIFAIYPSDSILGTYPIDGYRDIASVGFHDWNQQVEWLTIHGQSLDEAGYKSFTAGEPNNATTGEHCGGVARTGLFYDIPCGSYFPFICEKCPDSLEDCADARKFSRGGHEPEDAPWIGQLQDGSTT